MLNKKALAASVSAPPAVFVDDVFSTFLYTGTSAAQTITNGIDLAGEGGLVWAKPRDSGATPPNNANDHMWFDTARTLGNAISSNTTSSEYPASSLDGFTSSGFTLSGTSNPNRLDRPYASWTFRKQPKFFDVVTYTGNGTSGRTIAHSLGSVPGIMIIKCTNATRTWTVWHRSVPTPTTGYLILNATDAVADAGTVWNSTLPTSTNFTLGTSSGVNASGDTYVAYLFAHDAGGFGVSGNENVVSCGIISIDGSGNGSATLGYEPQWVLLKRTDDGSQWAIFDTMRGWAFTGTALLNPNNTDAESNYGATPVGNPTATGFTMQNFNASSTWIYMAIRRPMAVPTTGTEVFGIANTEGNNHTASFTPDSAWLFYKPGYDDGLNAYPEVYARLTGKEGLQPPNTRAANTARTGTWDSMTTFGGVFGSGAWLFKRSPNFFDVVCYTGTGSSRTVAHNLGVAPELVIIKGRSTTTNWSVWRTANGTGQTWLNGLNSSDGDTDRGTPIMTSLPTSTQMSIGSWGGINGSGSTYVAYLFASCPGVSKVFSYTGNGSSQTINCAFTAGARLVLIKRTDSTGDWYIWDSSRGIVSGNDPHLSLNTTAAEVTSDDTIDPDSSGFVVNQVAATNVNVSSATYIGIAIS